ncbi:MAG TPA: HAD family phosphatase [Candidatus Dormibacteraeota bacterium]|nr:HAD family phosphatase [Candidatus Dormibacteraeota bacterium]
MWTIIFDMDGVIVDSEPLHIAHLHGYLRKIGVVEPESFSQSLKGVSARDSWQLLIENFNLEQDIETLIEDARRSYVDYLESLAALPVIPGAIQLVKALHSKGYRLALGSSAAPKRIELFLHKLKLQKYFEKVVSGDDVKRSKPAPDIFLKAAELMKVKPSNCVVIEDANNGVVAAHAAGMKCIAYAGSVHNTDDLAQADVIIKDFEPLARAAKNGGLPV